VGGCLWGQPNPRGCADSAIDIAVGSNSDHRRTGLKRPGAQLRAGQVDYNPAWSPQRPLGSPQVLDHAQPRRGVITGAIDAHAVHALLEQVLNKKVVFRSLARHGDHDPDSAPTGCGPKQGVSVFGKQLLSLSKINDICLLRAWLPGRIC
jgi:hypothetical protein